MPSWIFTHIDPLPDMVVSYRNDFNDFKISLLTDESNLMKTKDIFHQKVKQDFFNALSSKNGLTIDNPETESFKLRLKGLFRKKMIIEFEKTEYSGMKIS